MNTNEKELVITVKKGTNVRVVEATTNDNDRDVSLQAPANFKVSVKRAASDKLEGLGASTISMCG
jgi:hypothetical protein